MLARLGKAMVRRRWIVVGAWLLLALLGGVLGGGVFGRAIDVPTLGAQAPSIVAKAQADRLDPEGPVIEAAVLGVAPYDPGIVADVQRVDNQIRALADIVKVDDLYNGHAQVGADNDSSIIRVHFAEHLTEARIDADEDRVVALLHGIHAPRVLLTGDHLSTRAFTQQATADSIKGESIALAVLVVVLLIAFRGARGAGVTLAVALAVICAGLLGLLGLSYVTSVSEFAVNIVTLFGIGLAVDYSVLLLFRFREARLADPDASVSEHVAGVMRAAGRAVLISGLAVAAAMAGLYLFGEPLLGAMALGGVVVVLFATLAALTLVPALLGLVGARLALPGERTWVTRIGSVLAAVSPWGPTRTGRSGAGKRVPAQRSGRSRPQASGMLGRLADFAQRRPVPVALLSTVGLLALAAPFLRANLGNSDARAMPTSMEVRQGYDAVQAGFDNNEAVPVTVVIHSPPAQAGTVAYLNTLERLPDVVRVSVRPDVPFTAAVVDVTPTGATAGPQSRALVRAIRAIAAPFPVEVGGPAAELVDYQASVASHLPFVVIVLLVAAGFLLYMLTGSLFIPVKALLLNVLTLGATLGVLVVTFQWGWGGPLLGFQPWGAIDLTTPLLLFIFVVGLTMDYEVFLLARIKEEWDRDHDTDRAVLVGLSRTSGVVTTAAASIVVVFLGFVLGGLTPMKEVGVGMVVAIVLDVTVVRGLLLPSLMSLLGNANWWAPRLLRRRPAPSGPARPARPLARVR